MAKKATRKRTSPRRKTTARPAAASKTTTAVRGAVAGAVAAVARHLPGAPDTPDAITLLENDHRRMQALLKEGEETKGGAVAKRGDLLSTITGELKLHEMIEEKVLYPALEAHPEGRDIVLEGFQEHHVADVILNELHSVARNDEVWGAKFKVLKENLEHHIDEEEGEMFRTARAVFTREQLQEMGAKMSRMKALAQRSRRR
jgi:hemerythrin-like domain-containing protein